MKNRLVVAGVRAGWGWLQQDSLRDSLVVMATRHAGHDCICVLTATTHQAKSQF